jgi:hypothetical protein
MQHHVFLHKINITSNEVCRATKCAKGKYENVHPIKVQPSAVVDISKKVTEVYFSLKHSSVSVLTKLQAGLPRNRAAISRAAERGFGPQYEEKNSRPQQGRTG